MLHLPLVDVAPRGFRGKLCFTTRQVGVDGGRVADSDSCFGFITRASHLTKAAHGERRLRRSSVSLPRTACGGTITVRPLLLTSWTSSTTGRRTIRCTRKSAGLPPGRAQAPRRFLPQILHLCSQRHGHRLAGIWGASSSSSNVNRTRCPCSRSNCHFDCCTSTSLCLSPILANPPRPCHPAMERLFQGSGFEPDWTRVAGPRVATGVTTASSYSRRSVLGAA